MDTRIVGTAIHIPPISEISKERCKHDCHNIFALFLFLTDGCIPYIIM